MLIFGRKHGIMEIGARLRKARLDKKLSQEEVAHHLNISQRTLSNIESNKSVPTVEQLSKMGELYDMDVLELLRQQGITFNQNNQEGENNGSVHYHHHYSDKSEQYKKRWKEQKEVNALLKKEIASLKEEVVRLIGKLEEF